MARKKAEKLTLSKRAKGFPLRMTKGHFLTIAQVYPWLQARGVTDDETDHAFSLLPQITIPQEDLDNVHKVGKIPSFQSSSVNGRWERPEIWKSYTFRIRAEDIGPVTKLFRLVAALVVIGNIKSMLVKQIRKLEEISALDLLYDAQRG